MADKLVAYLYAAVLISTMGIAATGIIGASIGISPKTILWMMCTITVITIAWTIGLVR